MLTTVQIGLWAFIFGFPLLSVYIGNKTAKHIASPTKKQIESSNQQIIAGIYKVIPELEVRVRNKRPYAHIRLGPAVRQEDVQWLNEMQALLEIPTLPFVRM